jgi:hypothetical protein
MTLRIVCTRAVGEAQVELHGRLSALEVPEFESACAAQAQPVRIDLTHLSGASAEGVHALREQRAHGARLTGASPYIELLLGEPSSQQAKGGRET